MFVEVFPLQSQHFDMNIFTVFRPNQQPKESDAETLRNARLEAQGIHVEPEAKRPRVDRRNVATDEQVRCI